MKNYSDVLAQLISHGLKVSHLEVGRLVRCKVDGDKEKRGWYALHEMPVNGESVLVGTYGIWRGDDNGLMKVELDKDCQLNKEQKAAIRNRVAEDKKRAEFERKRRASAAADRSGKAWHSGTNEGENNYFDNKNIQPHSVRYTKTEAAMVPMLDTAGRVHGIQFIFDSVKHKAEIKKLGRNKTYWPSGLSKKGHFHLIGGSPVDLILIAEGYATAASLYEATGIPTVVAFDANNLLPVGEAIRKRYKSVKIIFCADDDAFSKCMGCKKSVNVNDSQQCPHCNQPHKRKNTGVETAGLAAMQLGAYSIKPIFQDETARFKHYCSNKGKLTDYNDLHNIDGLHTVRVQIEAVIESNGLRRQVSKGLAETKQRDGDDNQLTPIANAEELLGRFALVFASGGMAFDGKEHILMNLSDVRDTCQNRETFKYWSESPERIIVRPENVGFDPTEKDKKISCNLWGGWPTLAKKGNCERSLELLDYLCGKEGQEMYQWVLKWLAYPIQHPGAKMKSTIVVHGPQGAGKNLIFEMIMSMYGRYGRTIDQSAIEDKFNDWASAKLFLIADEVVARSDLYHVKNKLKAFITGDWIRINPKNTAARDEKNHVNMVFLSNEGMPVALEDDDRRHAVIWTPPKLSQEFYTDVAEEIKNGGIEALHHHLLNLPLGGFDTHSKPPMNQAKQDLIELGRPAPLQFYQSWINQKIEGFSDQGGPDPETDGLIPIRTRHLYELFKAWCNHTGNRSISESKLIGIISKQPNIVREAVNYRQSQSTKNQNHVFIIPAVKGAKTPPEGRRPSEFYYKCVARFENKIDSYK